MKHLLLLLSFFASNLLYTQMLFGTGDVFPNYRLRPVVNAPATTVDVGDIKGKYVILNMWGTWCAPCIPEMDSLARLQRKFAGRVQVIGVSNDTKEKLLAYRKKRPTTVWLASDTSSILYRGAGFRFVGQSIIVAPDKRIIALVKTDSITTKFMERLLAGRPIASTAETGMERQENASDPFGIDSNDGRSVSVRSYMPGKSSMSLTYLGTALEGRRVTYFNVCPTTLYRDAYGLFSPSQIVYEVPKERLCDFNNKATLLCFDFLVKPTQRDSLRLLMQQTLTQLLPLKARMEERKLSVYVLRRDSSGLSPTLSVGGKQESSYSGNGFSGKAVLIKDFAQYLTNEAGRPVVDETGLTGRYDIETKLTLRTREEVLNSLKPLGLNLEKEERMVPVLVIGE